MVVNLDDVVMIQQIHNFYLVLYLFRHFILLQQGLADFFHCVNQPRFFMRHFEHFPIGTLKKLLKMFHLKNLTLREYQESIFQTAKSHNTLAVLETGLGKTAIALAIS